jgi:hypothetical protein
MYSTPFQTGELAIAALQSILNNPLFGTPFDHYQAQIASSSFNAKGQPDYLSLDPGVYNSGIQYVANTANPLRGVFCPAPRRANQQIDGIRYEASMELYTQVDLGQVFKVQEKFPKLQDKFVINGQAFYAANPAFPCQMGEAIAAWKIELALERYPVVN